LSQVKGFLLPNVDRRSLQVCPTKASFIYVFHSPRCLQARVMEDQKKFVSVPATTVIPLAQQAAAAVSAEVEASGGQKQE
jgi:hypothetical protein